MTKQESDSLTDFVMTAVFIALVIFVVKAKDAQQRANRERQESAVEQEVADALPD